MLGARTTAEFSRAAHAAAISARVAAVVLSDAHKDAKTFSAAGSTVMLCPAGTDPSTVGSSRRTLAVSTPTEILAGITHLRTHARAVILRVSVSECE